MNSWEIYNETTILHIVN